MLALSTIYRAFHLPSALFYTGLGAAILSSPKNLLAALHGMWTRSHAVSACREWTWKVIDLNPETQTLLEELKERLNLQKRVLIAQCSFSGLTRGERIYINPSDRENAPNFIGLSRLELMKTFNTDHPNHLYYRLLLLVRLVQIKERATNTRADHLYCAVVATCVAALHLTNIREKNLVGLALGQWAGHFCAASKQKKALHLAQLQAIHLLTCAELTRLVALETAGELPRSAFQSGDMNWRDLLTPYDELSAKGCLIWQLTKSELSQILEMKKMEEFQQISQQNDFVSSSSEVEKSSRASSNCDTDFALSPQSSFELVNPLDLSE